ncbi:MAG TPA: YfhO family protein [Candidatus Polarisedimenticolia bacterium]|nr:YfhO family protein [Candidatus Polarisedimenticolia bacterium]
MGNPPGAEPPRRLHAFLFIAAAVALLFHPLILGEGRLYFRDVSLNHYPNRVYATERLLHGDFPLWNPYLSGGMPLAANPNELILHPITLLFLLLPVGVAFSASVVLQYLLAGWGMYLWAREEGLGQESALLAAAGFALSGPLVSCGSLQNLLASWAWVPLALFAAARFRRTGSRWALLSYAGALSVTLLAGDPVAAASAVLIACFGAWESPRPAMRRAFLGPLAGAALAAGLALVALLPAREMVAASERGGGIPLTKALAWSIDPPRLLELAVPALYGNPAALKPTSYWGGLVFEKGYPFLLSVYLGILMLIFPAALPWRRAGGRQILLAAFALLCILTALGAPGRIYPLIHRWVPLASSLRYPSRFLLPATLALVFLAASGFDHRLRAWHAGATGRGRDTWVVVAWLAAGAALALALAPGATVWLAESLLGLGGKLPAASIDSIATTLRGSLLRCGGLAAGAGLVGWAASRGYLAPRKAALLLLVAAAGDLLSAHLRLNPVVPSSFYEARPPAADLVPRERIESRVYSEPRPEGFAVMAGSDDAWWGYYWDEISCRVATCLPWRIPLALDRSTDLLSAAGLGGIVEGIGGLDVDGLKRLCEIASVGLIQTYREMSSPSLTSAGLLSRQTNVPFHLYRLAAPRPRAYWVGAALPEKGGILADLTSPDWDPKGSVILQGESFPAGRPGEEGEVTWLTEKPERLELRVSASRAGWLVVTDTYFPGWQAEVDGAAAPIRRANHLFRAVQVPEGTHQVVLHYSPRSWRVGAAGSILTLLAALLWAWRGRIASRS